MGSGQAKERAHKGRVGARVSFVGENGTPKNEAMTIDLETQEEINRLDQAVDYFALEMKARLREQAVNGYRGWDDPAKYQRIVDMMVEHAAVDEGKEVDAAAVTDSPCSPGLS